MKYAIGAIITIALFAWLFSLCSPSGVNKTGHEYMPDMYHSVAYEANVISDYYWNTWDEKSIYTKAQLSSPRYNVEGAIPRGYTGVAYGGETALDYVRGKNNSNGIAAPVNPYAPYYYQNTEDERLRAEKETGANPFAITAEGLSRGKALYDIYCGICHGEKGDGQGSIVTVPDSKYPAQPANLIADPLAAAGNGRYYFAIMHGRNVMGAYADKLNFEERWQVIHHIRALQATAKKLVYNEKENTLNNIDRPGEAAANAKSRSTIVSPDSVNVQNQPAPDTRPAKTPGRTGSSSHSGK